MNRKWILAIVIMFVSVIGICFAVGTTRLSGKAGPEINLNTYLAGDLAELGLPIKVDNESWEYGTGANAVNIIYADTVTLTDGNNVTIDLYASGSYLDIFNRALTMTALKVLYIKNNSADATLEVGGGESYDLLIIADTNDIINVAPGATFLYTNPSAAGIVTTTNKNLKLVHNGTGDDDMDIDVIAMGLD